MTQAPGRASIVLDTCCVINLGAARDLSAMLAATPCESWMPSIAAREALHIRQPDPQDPAVLVTRALDLTPAIDAGHLHLCDLDGDETALFVAFAAELDDGEAAGPGRGKAPGLAAGHRRPKGAADRHRRGRRLAEHAGTDKGLGRRDQGGCCCHQGRRHEHPNVCPLRASRRFAAGRLVGKALVSGNGSGSASHAIAHLGPLCDTAHRPFREDRLPCPGPTKYPVRA